MNAGALKADVFQDSLICNRIQYLEFELAHSRYFESILYFALISSKKINRVSLISPEKNTLKNIDNKDRAIQPSESLNIF